MDYLENLTSGHIGLIVGVIAILVIITVWSFVKKRTVRGSGFPIDIAPSEAESINEAIGVLPDAGDASDKPTTIILPEDPKPYNADVRPAEASGALEHLGQLNDTFCNYPSHSHFFPFPGNGNPLQYSCLGNPMDEGVWWATIHRVIKSQTQLKWHTTQYVGSSPFSLILSFNIFPFFISFSYF